MNNEQVRAAAPVPIQSAELPAGAERGVEYIMAAVQCFAEQWAEGKQRFGAQVEAVNTQTRIRWMLEDNARKIAALAAHTAAPAQASTASLIESGALRQFRHNDSSGGLVFAYDKVITDRVLASMPSRLDLETIDRAMQHMGDALNEFDAAEEGDEQIAAPGFEAIARLLDASDVQPEQAKPTDLHAAIMALRCVNPYPEDNCNLYKEGYAVARQEAAELVAAQEAKTEARELTDAARDVLAERQRQLEVEGWTAERDDGYTNCELARAAATYAVCSHVDQLMLVGSRAWPWREDWFKRTTYRRDLIKAGALMLAEIERLDRDRAAIAERHLTPSKG